LKKATNVAYVPLNYKSYGFVGHNIKNKLNNTVSFAIDKKRKGEVIYMIDNPCLGVLGKRKFIIQQCIILVN
jgi:hypothetical protein